MNRPSRSALPLLALLFLALAAPLSAAGPPPAPLDARVLRALLASDFAAHAGDAGTAAVFGLEAARASPDVALAERAAADALQSGNPALVRAAFARWAELQPESPARDALALRFAISQGDVEEGRVLALSLLQADAVAPAAAALGADYPDGGVIARALLRALLDPAAMPARIEAWLAMAGAAQRLGDRSLQGQWVDALVQRFPADPRAGLLRAERLGQAGRRDEARAQVRRVLAQPALSDEQRRIAAEALAVLGDPVGAARAISGGAQDARTLRLRAGWLARAGRLDALRDLYTEAEALALAPNPAADGFALKLLLGGLAEQLQDWPAAERWYGELSDGEAGERARLRLGVVLARQGRGPEGRAVLRLLQQDDAVDGTVRRDAFLIEADQFEAQRAPTAAAEALARGLAVLEDDPALRVARARLAIRAGRAVDAEIDLRAVLARDPEYPPALRALGSLMLGQRRPAEAQELLARAWQVDPGAPTAAALGESLWRLDRRDEAIAAWSAGRARDPADPVLLDTLRRYSQ